MDVPRVTAIDLPLNVKNSERAIRMLGGKLKITSAVNPLEDTSLELRLRSDPFHHPVQLTVSSTEKVLLKVRIPKSSLPSDYHENPRKYPIATLIKLNAANLSTPPHVVVPCAIVDRTHLFKAISDFQVTTKNAKPITDLTNAIYTERSFSLVKKFSDSNQTLTGLQDYKNPENYAVTNLNLPPPPVLSPIKYPFDFKYQKNPNTIAVKDSSGQVRVVSKIDRITLHTMMIAYDEHNVPSSPPQPLLDIMKKWEEKPPAEYSNEALIIKCIEWLREMFSMKPVWTRRQLEDVIAPDLKKVLKQALPHLAYTYTSGPWRFCVVKYGADPRSNPDYWVHQSEYFKMSAKPGQSDFKLAANRVVPKTIADADHMTDHPQIRISESLFFTGLGLPATATYQIGDITDRDVTRVIMDHQHRFGADFFRSSPDFNDGWINKQTMGVIRGIVRYKLGQLMAEQPFDDAKIRKIIEADHTQSGDNSNIQDDLDVDEDDDDGGEMDETNIVDEDETSALDDQFSEKLDQGHLETSQVKHDNEESLLSNLHKLEDTAAQKLASLVGFIKQDSLSTV